MARIVRIHGFGGPEVLRLDEVAVAAPAAGEVRIRVAAFGLNRIEAVYRAGGFGAVRFPATIGYEAAGTIEAVGAGVTGWAVGDRVAALYGLSMERYGTYGELILYPADRLVPVPPGQSLIDAAASWMQYGTAFALVDVAAIDREDTVVVTAASSSVGLAAIQIARDRGATPIAITRGRGKAARLRELGAAHVIVADEEDVAARIAAITGGSGARVLFDAVGGAPLAALLPAIAPDGIAIVYGMLAGLTTEVPLPAMMMAGLTLRGWSADRLIGRPDRRRALTDYVGQALAEGRLKPVIDCTFPIERIADAHRHLESNAQIGKVVVTTAAAPA